MRSRSLLVGLPILAGCNQAPVIERVGDFLIADSISDYLNPDVTDFPYFETYAGETLTFSVVAVDPDEEPVYYSAGPLPVGSTFDPVTGTFSWTLEEEEVYGGGLELYVVAQDDEGAWDSVIVYLAVSYGEPYPYPYPYPEGEPPR